MIYLLHFDRPYGKRGVSHYLGRTDLPLEERVDRHRRGNGAALVRAHVAAGGDFVVSLAIETDDDAAHERALKRLHIAWLRICPVCQLGENS